MNAPARHPPELGALVAALGPLVKHVQILTNTPTGFMVRLHKDTPRPAEEAILYVFDRHAAKPSPTEPAAKGAPAPKTRKPRQRKAAPAQPTPPAADPGPLTAA